MKIRSIVRLPPLHGFGFVAFFLILLAILFAYGASLLHGFAPIDDASLILENLAARGLTRESLWLAFTTYDPELSIRVTLFSYQLDYLLGGTNPFLYHLTNLLLHIFSSFLVFLLLHRLLMPCTVLCSRVGLSSPTAPRSKLPAFFGALLFALHPLQTETVVWISARKDLLSVFFFLASFLAYLHARHSPLPAQSPRIPWMILLSLTFFTLGLLAKVTVLTLPLILLLLEWLLITPHSPLQAPRLQLPAPRSPLPTPRSQLPTLLPFFLLAFVFIVIAVLGKERVIASRTPLETILLSTKSIAVTLQHFFFPLSLSPIYEQRGAISFLSADFAVSALVALAVLGLAFFSLWRRPRVSFGLLFFLVTLAPTFLSFQKGSAVFYAADHYAYLPSIGLLLALTVFLCERLEGAPTRLWRRIFGVSSIVLFLFLVLLSMKQTSIWESPERLFSHALALQPESVAARTALATVLRTSDRHEEAFELLRQGLRYGSDPDLHLQAGIIYAEVGKLREAREQFAKVLEEDPKRPEPHHYLGILAEVQGETNVALRDYAQAVKLDPSYVAARTKLARILFKEGRMEEAREQVEEALRWNPSFSEARELLRTLP